ncbi:RDD family protein [Tumebacillus sp. DT12]|uniref:RDD family protein n=1 Tax=Tumebacillus lacus TaxID=2995335 RepID=A0ABT3X572_9BACL|nr:RDD family protein [Tumebacillus lacus]MCX7572034.1 RDD family protein [Tumebacillus lacus]
MTKASFGIRLGALLIDSILVGIIASILIGIFMVGALSVDGTEEEQLVVFLIGYLFVFVAAALYSVVLPAIMNGQTLGKKILGIRIVRKDGARVSFGRLLLREVIGRWVNSITFLIGYLIALGEDKRGLHDYIGGTIVVKA